MKAVAFDLGDTLVTYAGFPLSWEAHYPAALTGLANALGHELSASMLAAALPILRRYNTRIYPRTHEVEFRGILAELLPCFGHQRATAVLSCARVFFRPFRQKLTAYPETSETLAALRRQGLRVGVFTDVPYGMPRELVAEDLEETALTGAIDALLTSGDVGQRKPAIATLAALAERLSCPPEDMVYVGNEAKDMAVARAFGCQAVLIDRNGTHPDWGQDRTLTCLSELI